jgi:hypothetical protein
MDKNMRWIVQESEFKEIFLKARTCVYIDSGREATALKRFSFDDIEIGTTPFGNFLHKLMELSSDQTAHCIVLDPDPVHYFHRQFHKYPVLEIVKGDSANAYLAGLNEDPGGSPIDAIGTYWWAFVIVPPSLKWFVHALRSDMSDGGHLWIPMDYVEEVRKSYPSISAASLYGQKNP